MLKVYINKVSFVAVLLVLIPTITLAAKKPTIVAAVGSKNTALFIEGQDYTRLPNQVRNNPDVATLLAEDPDKVQVLFFFSYGCVGCELFHAPFEKWSAAQLKKPDNKVVVYRYPVSFNPKWAMLAKLYYTMEFLDPTGKLNVAIFKAIHKNGLEMWKEPVMQTFFAGHGYNTKQFTEAFNSFGVNRQVKQADEISITYKITLTPDIIVNGPDASYRVDLTKAGNNVDRFFKILDYLVARETKLLPK